MTLNGHFHFDIDPSQRGILVFRTGGDVATAMLSLENAWIDLALKPRGTHQVTSPQPDTSH